MCDAATINAILQGFFGVVGVFVTACVTGIAVAQLAIWTTKTIKAWRS